MLAVYACGMIFQGAPASAGRANEAVFLAVSRMEFIADLHIHSRYSMATSRRLCPSVLHAWAQRKGITVVGTGDFTHPAWRRELQSELEPAEEGLFRLMPILAGKADLEVPDACRGQVRFMLSAEVSSIYRKGGKVRRVHTLIYARDFSTAERISRRLAKIGNLASDGRPILKLDCEELLKIVVDCGENAFVVPAHIWTPHFSVLGAFSDFNSIEECYGRHADEIFALETGLSSDPPMNWRLSALDRFTLVSNSDAHSGEKLGREANLFDTDLSFAAIVEALRAGDGESFRGTLEFFPQEGKYHYDGHRRCGIRLSPKETKKLGGLCPACGGKVTPGVCYRVDSLADRPEGYRPKNAPGFESLVPLQEVLAECIGKGSGTKAVARARDRLLAEFGPEFRVLREVPVEELQCAGVPRFAEAVRRLRAGEVRIAPGYDGQFGTVALFEV